MGTAYRRSPCLPEILAERRSFWIRRALPQAGSGGGGVADGVLVEGSKQPLARDHEAVRGDGLHLWALEEVLAAMLCAVSACFAGV